MESRDHRWHGRVLYPKDTYSVPNSVYSDTTVGRINGVVVETYKGDDGEIVVQIPSGLRNGKMTIELTNSEDTSTIDNVFHLNDSSIPLFSGNASLICSGMQFYNASGILTTGTKNCSGPTDCTTDGEVGCVANASAPAALTGNLVPGDIRSGQTIGGGSREATVGLGVVLIAMALGLMTAQPILVFQLWS